MPKPTVGGEIWVFNKNYTQYIPVSIYDIQTWLGSPCIYVYDCNNAGNILSAFIKFAVQRDAEMSSNYSSKEAIEIEKSVTSAQPSVIDSRTQWTPLSECIQLAACRPNELLPMHPDLPADIFTCCLTTPIEIALRWFVSENMLIKNIPISMLKKIPGRLNDRRTPLGELNWIFTAVTDTIAWNTLPHALFQKLFRQDLMVAALFRNFLLAERIMRHYGCHPMSSPVIPSTYQHSMWQAWDLALDVCLVQLPDLLESQNYEYIHSSFFAEQLTAFEVGLSRASISKKPQIQLPIVLQVLLSQVHRLRALMLLSRFLDLGSWAVHQALSVGIFPYVLKLLQSPAAELKPVLVFIWCKILAVDHSCKADLLKDSGFTYFIGVLAVENENSMPSISNISEHRAMCAFILAVFCSSFPSGQKVCLKADLAQTLLPHLTATDSLLRQWACICFFKLWENNQEIKSMIARESIHEHIVPLLVDPVPQVRSSALLALSGLIGDLEKVESVVRYETTIMTSLLTCIRDASPLVRKELIIALSRFISENHSKILTVALELLEEEKKQIRNTLPTPQKKPTQTTNDSSATVSGWADIFRQNRTGTAGSIMNSIYGVVWKSLLILSVDSFPSVSLAACAVVDKIIKQVLCKADGSVPITAPIKKKKEPETSSSLTEGNLRQYKSLQNINKLGEMNETSSGESSMPSTLDRISRSIRRSASLAFNTLFSNNSMYNEPPSLPAPENNNGGLAFESTSKAPETTFEDEEYAEDESRIEIRSFLFEWSCEYFSEPQMKVLEIDDPGTSKFNERLWRAERNDFVLAEIKEQKISSGIVLFYLS